MSSALTPLPHRAASSPGRTSPPYSNESCGIVRVRSHAAGPGEIYPLPLPGSSGAPLRPLVRPQHVPVYVAAMGPHNLRLTGEVADGWLGNAFIPEAAEVFLGPLGDGARRAGRALGELDLVAPVVVEFHDDEASADAATRRRADGYAFTIGAMGARGRNFYNDAFTRLGYGAEVGKVAQFWQAGKQGEARAVVPIDLGRLTNLVGTAEWIADRVRRYREIGITTLLAKLEGDYDDQLTALGRLADIIGATAES
jgi:alkanesulfonate monooxygenase SsuD/methylene tetrahydromethanopterin reductase-like flavin-dependent oxidoreductase (luciferase family)